MFTNSNILQPYVGSTNADYSTFNDNRGDFVTIYFKTDQSDDIFRALNNKEQRIFYIWSDKMYPCKITEYYKNIFYEVVLHVKISKTLRKEIDNSENVSIFMSLHEYNDTFGKKHIITEFSLYI